jgi:hypothetical protein
MKLSAHVRAGLLGRETSFYILPLLACGKQARRARRALAGQLINLWEPGLNKILTPILDALVETPI